MRPSSGDSLQRELPRPPKKKDMPMKYRLFAAGALLLVCGWLHAQPQDAEAKRPVLVYTDIVSGPNSGGENNKGIYLSLFGKNFGSGGLGTRLRVYIGGAEVGDYRALGVARGRHDIQQITVQVGALGNPKPGMPLPIKVVVDGIASNDDLSFTVNPGRILFVDNVKGDDRTAVPGDIRRPFRHAQTARLSEGAWGQAGPGDFIVLRGTGQPWTDRGYQNYFLRTRDKSGSLPAGTPGTGPIGIMGYPGEDVFIYAPYDAKLEEGGATGAISAVNGLSFPGLGQWFTVTNLRVEGGGHDGAVNVQIHGDHWRVVNNELTAATAVRNIDAKAGGIVGNGKGEVWLGNWIHDVYCGPAGGGPLQNHGIYIDGDGDYEIAYNVIERIPGGSGFQTYVNGSNGSDTTGNVSLHHNLIDGVGKHGINLADGTRENVRIYNNVVRNTAQAGLRLNTMVLSNARVYNNTFYYTNLLRKPGYGALMNDWRLPLRALDLQNNIFVPSPGTELTGGTVGLSSLSGTIHRNFWHGDKPPVFDSYAQSGTLRFADPDRDLHLRPGSWAIDAGSPAVATLVKNDYDITTRRPQGLAYDIGAYELQK
ncbi:right-handed parallel beta-helix repeat-containing protein [Oxalobacteraceae bacterium OM1]|nr:right-handed parallel beta-helix repeat-containing protein [Oxalobacteraceae bacterium OM1]